MNRFSASRRELLLGVGTIGIASLGAGVGTYAAFSDSDRKAAIVTAGGLDLTVRHESTYNGESADVIAEGDDDDPGVLFELPAVVPGDSGRSRFCFELRSNPAYLWLCGELITNAENGLTESERDAGDSDDSGELADAVDVTLAYADKEGNTSETITEGSLRTVLDELSEGIPLDAEARGDIEPGAQREFEPGASDGALVEPCLAFEWEIPESVGNEIQTDRVEFSLTFYAQQARHTDGTDNPCDDRADDGEDDTGDDGDDDDNRRAISFVAVCVDDGELVADDVVLSVAETNDEGEPLAVDWETDDEVDRVVLKTGGGRLALENFPGGTSGTATVGAGDDRIDGQTPSTPCPNAESSLKFEFDSEQGVFVAE